MLKSCMGKSGVVLQLGFYKAEPQKFRRLAGHFVTLVGFREEKGIRVVLIHDPGLASGLDKKRNPAN